MNQSNTYEYADGSANLYLITPTELKFLPVETELSSSGTYQGGVPKTVAISTRQYEQLKNVFDQAIDNKSMQIENRVMMSGMISVIGDKRKQCIITPNSAAMTNFEDTLKNILGN